MNPRKIDPQYAFSISMEDFDERGNMSKFTGDK